MASAACSVADRVLPAGFGVSSRTRACSAPSSPKGEGACRPDVPTIRGLPNGHADGADPVSAIPAPGIGYSAPA
jgi:hypothetical protein